MCQNSVRVYYLELNSRENIIKKERTINVNGRSKIRKYKKKERTELKTKRNREQCKRKGKKLKSKE